MENRRRCWFGCRCNVYCRCSYCWWLNSGVHQLRLVVHPIIDRVSYIPGSAGFQPSTVLFPCAYHMIGPSFSSPWKLRVANFGGSIKFKSKSNAFMVPWPTHTRTTLITHMRTINPYDRCAITIPHQRPWTPILNLMQYSLIRSAGISLLKRYVMSEHYPLHTKQRH